MKTVRFSKAGQRCQLSRSFATFDDAWNANKRFNQSRQNTLNKLDNKNRDGSPKWYTAPSLRTEGAKPIPGAGTYESDKQKYQRAKQSRHALQQTESNVDLSKPMGGLRREFHGNANIKLTRLNSSKGGKQDVYFAGIKEMDNSNSYQKNWTNFLIEHGFVEESDINEQFEWLQESYKLQYDPDDSDGLRLPPDHAGRASTEDWTEKELYFGRRFRKEKLEFNHFNKSFILDSCPPFPDRMVHHEPTDQNEAPLYLPHISQNIPTWTLRKKIAKTYGPSYLSAITMPPVKLPDKDDFQAMLKQFANEKKYKKFAVDNMQRIEDEYGNDDDLEQYLNEKTPNKWIDSTEYKEENRDRVKMLGVGTPFHGKEKDLISREYEVWDKDLCYELKHDGDPSVPKEFKDEIFRQYVTSIDRNGSMAPWQKNYAFSLLPKAFGGPEGDYIEVILSKMKPKQEKVQYELKKFGEENETKKIGANQPSKKKPKTSAVDVAGLGL